MENNDNNEIKEITGSGTPMETNDKEESVKSSENPEANKGKDDSPSEKKEDSKQDKSSRESYDTDNNEKTEEPGKGESDEKQDEKKQTEIKDSDKVTAKEETTDKSVPVKKKPKKKVIKAPEEQYVVSSSPHIFGKDNVSKIMWTVSACLAPAGIAGIYIFGIRVLAIIIVSILGAVAAEYAWQKITGKPVTINDGSAFLTGLLLAYNLPPSVPLWLPLVGSFFAIIIAKQLFGGLGFNIFNPALAARGFLLASWPQQMTTWWQPRYWQPVKSILSWDGITKATPLFLMKDLINNGKLEGFREFISRFPSIGKLAWALLWGNRGGCIGETCAILLILGGLYLIYKKYIDWQVPVAYIGTVAVLLPIFYGSKGNIMDIPTTVIFSTLTGGLILGAFYMATDYVTTPSTVKGRVIFAIGCGILTSIIRRWGGLPEGVCYSILIMNAFTPLIDARVRTRVYGVFKKKESPA